MKCLVNHAARKLGQNPYIYKLSGMLLRCIFNCSLRQDLRVNTRGCFNLLLIWLWVTYATQLQLSACLVSGACWFIVCFYTRCPFWPNQHQGGLMADAWLGGIWSCSFPLLILHKPNSKKVGKSVQIIITPSANRTLAELAHLNVHFTSNNINQLLL